MLAGLTDAEPDVAFPVEKPPAALQEEANEEPQESVVDWPASIVAGLAESVAVAGQLEFDGVPPAEQEPSHWIEPVLVCPHAFAEEEQEAP